MSVLRRLGLAVLNGAAWWLPRRPRPTPVDVLQVQPSPHHVERMRPVVARLEAAGLSVASEVYDARDRLWRWRFARPRTPVDPPGERHHAAHAAFLVARYAPRLVFGSLEFVRLPVHLRRELQGRGALVNVPHCPPNPDAFTMFAFDYYFAFGPRAVDTLRATRVRVGSTRVVQSGSPLIGPEMAPLPLPSGAPRVLFVAQRTPYAPASVAAWTEAAERLVLDWARARPELRIDVKPHYTDPGDVLRERAHGLANVTVLGEDTSLGTALARASVVVTMSSAAAIEAALLERPLIVCGPPAVPDVQLELLDYFGARAGTTEALDAALARIRASPEDALAACRAFVARHLARTSDGQAHIAELLLAVADGASLPGEELPATVGLDGRPL